MIELETMQTVPLIAGEDGVIRITGSRVTLDSIVSQFKRGATAEEIQHAFPSLSLREIYGAISYYLEHTGPGGRVPPSPGPISLPGQTSNRERGRYARTARTPAVASLTPSEVRPRRHASFAHRREP